MPATPKKSTTATPTAVTPLSEWGGGQEGFLVTLPSGKTVRMKRGLDLPVQLSAGLIPNPLAQIIRESMHNADANFMASAAQDPKALEQMMAMVDRNVCSTVLEPKITMPTPRQASETDEQYVDRLNSWEPDEGTLSIWMVDVQDRLYIMTVAQGRAADLESFLSEQESGLAAVQAGREVRRATERASRAKKPAPKRKST